MQRKKEEKEEKGGGGEKEEEKEGGRRRKKRKERKEEKEESQKVRLRHCADKVGMRVRKKKTAPNRVKDVSWPWPPPLTRAISPESVTPDPSSASHVVGLST